MCYVSESTIEKHKIKRKFLNFVSLMSANDTQITILKTYFHDVVKRNYIVV